MKKLVLGLLMAFMIVTGGDRANAATFTIGLHSIPDDYRLNRANLIFTSENELMNTSFTSTIRFVSADDPNQVVPFNLNSFEVKKISQLQGFDHISLAGNHNGYSPGDAIIGKPEDRPDNNLLKNTYVYINSDPDSLTELTQFTDLTSLDIIVESSNYKYKLKNINITIPDPVNAGGTPSPAPEPSSLVYGFMSLAGLLASRRKNLNLK